MSFRWFGSRVAPLSVIMIELNSLFYKEPIHIWRSFFNNRINFIEILERILKKILMLQERQLILYTERGKEKL